MRLYFCDRKIVLRFHNEGTRFIRDYSTNTTSAPQNAFIDGKGRIVAFFDQHRVSEDEMLVVMERRFVDKLQQHLSHYLYISDTKIDPADEMRVYWDLDGDAEPEGGILIPQKAGRLWLTSEKTDDADVADEDMTRLRIRNEIPWQGIDFSDEMVLSVADEERISYLKGCYLGQEIVARVHYRGKPPQKLVTKMLRDLPKERRKEMTSLVTDHASGEIMGFVFDKVDTKE